MVELADEQLGNILPTKVKSIEDVWEDVGYYTDERGIKRWGIIPKQNNKPTDILINNEYEIQDGQRRTSDPRTWGY